MIYHGDCIEVMKSLPENSIDTCITDPPYGLGFMGKKWDSSGIAFQPETWQAVFRVLKPGAILLAFGGTRTYHRMVCAIEDAGFEIRDMVEWMYSTGFPKSLDIGKAIDKKAGKEPVVIGKRTDGRYAYHFQDGNNQFVNSENNTRREVDSKIGLITAPSTPEAQLWDGWGTALKPAHEPIVVAMKPLDGNFVNNALKWGVAGLWIDGGRVGMSDDDKSSSQNNWKPNGYELKNSIYEFGTKTVKTQQPSGRFPANLIHDGSDEVTSGFPQTGKGAYPKLSDEFTGKSNITFRGAETRDERVNLDSGSAARFFYCAKASRKERNAGLEGMEEKQTKGGGGMNNTPDDVCGKYGSIKAPAQNHHPTVKPIELMRYLVRLTKTPTGGVVLDPFAGSGTTGIACVLEGRDFIGIEKEAEYIEIAERRIAHYELPLLQDVLSGV